MTLIGIFVFTFDGMPLGSFNKQVENLRGASEVGVGCIGSESEHEEDNQNNNGMCVVCEESRFDTTEHGVEYYTDGKQEASSSGRDTSERGDNGGASSKQHRRDQNVGEQAEDHEDDMCDCSIACPDNFKEGMRVRCSSFQFNCNGSKKNDLDGSARRIPKRSADTIVVCDRTRLE